jgi:hypothetical protein
LGTGGSGELESNLNKQLPATSKRHFFVLFSFFVIGPHHRRWIVVPRAMIRGEEKDLASGVAPDQIPSGLRHTAAVGAPLICTYHMSL